MGPGTEVVEEDVFGKKDQNLSPKDLFSNINNNIQKVILDDDENYFLTPYILIFRQGQNWDNN